MNNERKEGDANVSGENAAIRGICDESSDRANVKRPNKAECMAESAAPQGAQDIRVQPTAKKHSPAAREMFQGNVRGGDANCTSPSLDYPTSNDAPVVAETAGAQKPIVNTDIRHEAAGNLAFLLSVIRCGEQLSDAETENVRRVIRGLEESQEDPPKSTPDCECRKALEQIRRTPTTPFPDPGAHSERAWSRAVHRAYCHIQRLAAEALSHPCPCEALRENSRLKQRIAELEGKALPAPEGPTQ